ncbi:hypothetical protein Peur_011275 [Populus x canadensis]
MQEARWQPTDRQRRISGGRLLKNLYRAGGDKSITTISESTVHVLLRLLDEFGSLLRGDATKAVQKKTSILKRVCILVEGDDPCKMREEIRGVEGGGRG